MSKSFTEMHELSQKRSANLDKLDKEFMRNVIKTEWYQQIEILLASAEKVYRVVHELNGNALIYCNQGTSGTAILSSLA